MRRTATALLLLALLAGLAVWWGGPKGGAGGALAPAAVEGDAADEPRPASDAAAPPETPARRAEAAADAGAPREEGSPEFSEETDLVRLRGRLARSDDGGPAPQARLVFLFDGEATSVITDDAGRFATERVVPPGPVQVVHGADARRPEYACALEVEPRDLLVPAGGAEGEVPPLELTLVVPDAWLAVEVQLADGRAAAGASVEGVLERVEDGLLRPARRDTRPCGADGRARLPLFDVGAGARAALYARREGLVSELVELAPPWPREPVRLTLEAGAELRVRVVDEAGRPVAGRRVHLARGDRTDGFGGGAGTTPESGALAFPALLAGRYRAFTWVEELRERISAEIELERGALAELMLAVPRLELLLAAAGSVLDEAGAPLAGVEVALEHESGKVLRTDTDAAGRFEILAEPCGVVTVAMDRDPWGDEYEPPRRRVAFGARGLEFARRAEAELESLLLEVVDARTGERVPGAAVMPYRAPNLGDYSMFRAEEGVVTARFKALESLGFGVAAPGYRRRYVPRGGLLSGGEGAQARVELERGFERVFLVRATDGAPLRGAELRVVGERVATTDVEGLARIDLPEWPAALYVSAAGHAPADVAPADFLWDLGPALVELQPVGAGSK